MKLLILFLLFTFSAQAKKASSQKLELTGEIKEKIALDYNHGSIQVQSNAPHRKVIIKRSPASLSGYEQIELKVP